MNKALYGLLITLTSFSINAQIEVYNEDFQNGMPGVISIVDNDGLTPHSDVSDHTQAWITTLDPQNSSDTVAASTSYFDPTGQADRWLITPDILVGAFGNVLEWEAKSHDPSYPDDYLVLVSRTDLQLSSFTDTVFNVVNELATWQSRSVNLSDSMINSESIHIAFVNRTNNGFKLYIDDIKVISETPVGIEENFISEPIIFPNPAENVININGVNSITSAELYTIAGRHILTTNYSSIDVSKLESGRYLLNIVSKGRTYRKQFIKR